MQGKMGVDNYNITVFNFLLFTGKKKKNITYNDCCSFFFKDAGGTAKSLRHKQKCVMTTELVFRKSALLHFAFQVL